jgi:phospholipid/cholesterol/gamma-HCH transport system substrate-binding protein
MKSRLEWKVGVFLFMGLVLLAVLVLMFSKGTSPFKPTMNILLHSDNVSGLKVRAQVLMSGVQVGTVSDMQLAPEGTNVTITLRIYSQHQIHPDARFIIESSGFLGDEYVAILPTKNQGPILHDGDSAEAEVPFNLLEAARSANGFLQRIDETARRLNAAIARIDTLVLNEKTLTNLSAGVANFRRVSESAIASVDRLDRLVESNGPAVGDSVSNFQAFAAQLKKTGGTLDDLLGTNGVEITAAVKNIESSSEKLKGLLEDVQNGKGVAGGLIKNEQLATNMANIVYNLSITTSNLNRLGLWGILWQHKPPKRKAAEFESPPAASK